jgi:hypothetical protein
MDVTKAGLAEREQGAGSACASATPRDRNIWEDVLSMAPGNGARSPNRIE